MIHTSKQMARDFYDEKGRFVNISVLKSSYVYPGLALAISLGKFKRIDYNIFGECA